MKKTFKIKKSVVESMVDNAIHSLVNEGFDYDDLSQDVMHWALNYADTGHDYPLNAVQSMQEWYNGDESALDAVCEKFAEWKGIECDENVRNAVEKAANQIGYYENWNNEKIEFDEAKESQAVEDLKKKVRSMSQKISSTDEELPELKRQMDALKNKLSTMNESFEDGYDFEQWLMDSYSMDLDDFENLPYEDRVEYVDEYDNDLSMADDEMRTWQRDESMVFESFKSQKLKNFAREHGGLKNGKWSASFENDLYNMSDEDFDAYEVVDQDEHYRKYGLNGTDTTGYTNNNFQPIEFGDGTFMAKKNPELRWDDRAKGVMDKQIDRRNSRRNDGKNEYQFENPYLNNKFNQDYHISKPRGSWGYGTDWKLEPSNINMTALRSMEGYDKYPGDVQHGDVAAKAKASRKGNVSESKLNNAIQKSIKKVLNEGSQKEREEKCIDGICFKFAYHDINGNPIWCTDNEQFGKANYWRRHKDGLWYGQSYSLRADVDNFKGKTNLNEGIYDYPDGIDNIIFLSENDRELYDEYRQIAKACMKLYKKDVQLTLERLMESSIMKIYQQHCFKKYAKEQQGLDRMNSPREFRRFIAEKIIDEVVNGAWDDREINESLNESYVWWGDTKPLETIYGAAQEIVRKYGDADPEGDYESTAIFDLVKWANEVMDEADKYIHYEAHNTAIGENKLNEENGEQPKQYGYQNVPDEFVEKVGENGYDVLVPDWCLPYLVNGDMDVYDEDEIAEMQAFEKQFEGKLLNGMNAGDFCIPMDGEEPALVGKNDVFPKDMGAECYKFFLPAKESEQMNEVVFPRVKDDVLQNLEWIRIPDDGSFEGGMSCGIIDHEKKTVSPCHGYYFPNPKSRVLLSIAKKLGYRYNDEELEKYKKNRQK